jgi:hypothetical protein
MRRFFDKRATVVDVTDKEVIDCFQDGLYHCHTFEDFGRHCPSSISKLKDVITSWADEEDKAKAKYDSNRDNNKNNIGSNNNKDKGVASTTKTTTTQVLTASASQKTLSWLYSALRRTVVRRPPWHQDINHTTEQCYQLRRVSTVNFRQPSHEFTFGVGMNFISYRLVLTIDGC